MVVEGTCLEPDMPLIGFHDDGLRLKLMLHQVE